ncbi:mechanosensitive ion channel family protein [Granulicella cerasi]|uniref:Mechanosensitive ion channel family protein n=1 Tax=Granulicella cerasi TaxID=741063 RepID=A0ABW1Z5S1_9BACT
MDFVQTGLPKIVVALILAFIAGVIVRFFVSRLRKRADAHVGNSHRAAQLRTLSGIIRATAFGLIGAYLVMQILGAVGVPLGTFIASAGVIGLGISFGAQSIFKDMLTGIFVLVEDQYSVGDVVKLAGLTGTVEDFTLRITQLRDGDGTLYIVPNSQITTVSNLSRDFSIATLNVSVDPKENPDRVVEVLTKLAQEVRQDAIFNDIVISDPTIVGVDKISGNEAIYPISVRVRANQRDGVLRELRRRILLAFARERIAFGATSSTILLQHDPTAAAPSTAS